MKRYILNPIGMAALGLMLGAVSRLLDIYTQNLGNIFSQPAIWILFGVLISVYSPTRKKAMLNILPFCIGMLATYYFTAFVSDGVYGEAFIIGWTLFALLSPLLAYFTWMTKQSGVFPKLIGVGIVAVSFLSSVILFDGPRVYDFVIDGALIYILFLKKVKR